jgi:hypothetical protein
VARAVHICLFHQCADGRYVFGRQGDLCAVRVFLQSRDGPCAGDRNNYFVSVIACTKRSEPTARMLGEDPRQGDLARGRAVFGTQCLEVRDECEVPGEVLA